MATPILGITDWAEAQATPWITENQAKRILEAFSRAAIIEDRDLAAPPGSCADGACYLIDAPATGAWAGEDGNLAIAVGTNAASGWYFVTVAVEGTKLYIKDEDREIIYNGSDWQLYPDADAIGYTPVDPGNYAATVQQALDELYVLAAAGGGGGGGGSGLWSLVQTETLTGATGIDLESFAGDSTIAALKIIVDVVMSVDGSSLVMQIKQGGSYITAGTGYQYNLSQRSSSGSTNSESSNGGALVRPAGVGGTWGIGNASNESLSLEIMFLHPMEGDNPISYVARGSHGAPSGARVYCDGGGSYNGTGYDSQLQGIRLLANNDEGANQMTGVVNVFALKTS